ncbi:CaiB/BaiF CoA transferase family protein [Faunimonas sp. B44]|uniref:CaiB/BaiF CoA transferase family protein n=1 Tax=Faunimonas sp. B44 TaxID=3461493 RepID=UPI0040439A9A
MAQPLSGLTVLDFSTLLPGPLAALMLAEAGARVVKVERPGGEDMRRFPPFLDGRSAIHAMLNRGKEVVFLDLKSDEGRDRALALAREADILVEQFRPGVMARLGLGYEVIGRMNPRIVYCSITGYGQTGPRAGEVGHDVNYIGNTGLLAQSWGTAERPVLPPTQIADIGGGTFPAVINILLALLARQRTGRGLHLDIAMCDAMFTFAVMAHAFAGATGQAPANGAGLLTGGSPRYGLYPARCGTPICVGALEEPFWMAFCDAVGLPPDRRNDAEDPAAVWVAVAEAVRGRTASEWRPILAAANCCATVLEPLEAALGDPHFVERGLVAGRPPGGSLAGLEAVLPIAPAFRAEEQGGGTA